MTAVRVEHWGHRVAVAAAVFVLVTGRQPCAAEGYQEYDTTERESAVYLFTRPVSPTLPNDAMYHHWALVFHFEGDDVRTVEGFQDEDDRLYPAYSKGHPKEEGTYYMLAKVWSSPADVLEMAYANRYNYGTYSATWVNCQAWAKEIAAMLGPEISSKLDDFKTLKEAHPVFAFAGKTASGFSRASQAVYNSRASQAVYNSRVSQSVYNSRASQSVCNAKASKSASKKFIDLARDERTTQALEYLRYFLISITKF